MVAAFFSVIEPSSFAVTRKHHSIDVVSGSVESNVGEDHTHVQNPTPNATKTGNEVRQPEKEDAEAEDAREEANRQEEMTQHPGWLLIVAGLLIAGVGVVWLITPSIPWLGKLPGDISVEQENFKFYFPIVTCIVISLLLTGILWLVRFLSK